MKQKQIIILGGGASGLAAAIVAARAGRHVTLLERGDRVGRKLLATGNGRCNLANTGGYAYYGDAGFAREVLGHMPPRAVLDFFDGIGLPTRAESSGRVYPACNQAAAVLDVLRCALDASGVQVLCGTEAREISRQDGRWRVRCPQEVFTADSVIVCCGGLAGPRLGAVGSYGLLTALGCRMIPAGPALTPLETEKAPLKGLSGLRLPAVLTLCCGEGPVEAARGEVLFTDYGVSGVCAMQLARTADTLLQDGKIPRLYIDFSPSLGLGDYTQCRMEPRPPREKEPVLRDWMRRREQILPPEQALLGALPRLLREKLAHAPARELPELLCAYPLTVTGVRGYDQAQVTRGGIDCACFDPSSMQHRQLPGLYACGEILNVDGDCGGFNLQFAFATGLLAGQACGKR